MPYTINGIGTRYYGKQNLQQRPGVCRSCGRQATLASYDTRLWFVVFFVPLIPLGRKHIIDACPVCRRHFVTPLEKWEMAKQLETSGALEKFRSDPTPDNAIQAHQQLIGFHQIAEAAELQRTMEEKFADNARVQIYLAGTLMRLGKTEPAAALFQRALELRPDLPEARSGVAEGHIRAGRLDEARSLLDFLEIPGAAQLYSLAPLERLALSYQKAGRHEPALELFDKIIQALPQVAQNPRFRKMVKSSEQALRRPATILPKAKFSFRRLLSQPPQRPGGVAPSAVSAKQVLIVFAALAAIAFAGLVVSNAIIRHHRTVYIVNGTEAMLQGEISGLGRIKIPRGVTPVKLSEGHYLATFDPPFQDEVAFDIRARYFDRWLAKPAWILNPGGAAIILCQRIVYAKNPQPGSFTCEYGRKFAYFPDVDFPFTTPPKQMNVPSGQQQKVQNALQFFQGAPLDAFAALTGARRQNEACQLAEWRLAGHPDDRPMLAAYVQSGAGAGDAARAARFLQDGLAARPVRIEWHRAYQNLLLVTNRQPLIAQYDRMLAAEPADSALLYLRGRLCGNSAEGRDYFNRSLQADADNPYPAFALAYDAASTADWASAKHFMDHVIEQQPGNVEFLALWTLACLGLDQPGLVVQPWRRKLQDDPADFQAELNLCQALLMDHKEADAHTAASDYRRAVMLHYGQTGRTLADAVDYELLYMLGDFASLEKTSCQDPSPRGRNNLFAALIEQNRPQEAAQLIPLADASVKDPFQLLAMSLAWRVAGNSAEAEKCQDRASALFRSSGDREHVADLLSGAIEPTAQVVNALALAVPPKALLLATLSFSNPVHRSELAAAARRLNVERVFPYRLVQRATEDTR
jgi:tetratricopeptide (TPR) repeat protein